MDNISRRRFVRMLAGIPLIVIATRSAFVMAERTSPSHSQIRLVDHSAK